MIEFNFKTCKHVLNNLLNLLKFKYSDTRRIPLASYQGSSYLILKSSQLDPGSSMWTLSMMTLTLNTFKRKKSMCLRYEQVREQVIQS